MQRIQKLYNNFYALNEKNQAISMYKKLMDKKCNTPVSVASPEDIHEDCLQEAKSSFIIKTSIIDRKVIQHYEVLLKKVNF